MARRTVPQLSRRTAARILIGLAVATAVVVAVLVLPSSTPAHAADPWDLSGTPVLANLPVTPCETSFGVPHETDRDLPTYAEATVTRQSFRHLVVFTDGLGTIDVVGPSTWQCTALDAVDGSSTLVVYPPGVSKPTWGDVTAVRRGIVASQTGACSGCSLETACPLFPAAAHRYAATYGQQCHRATVRGQQRYVRSSSTVLFIDPPGVQGAGRPSGGGFTAYGAMLWHLPGDRASTAWLDTCTLPSRDADLCVLSVRAFLQRHPH